LAQGRNAKLLIAHVSERELYPVGESFDEEAEPNHAELAELQAVTPAGPVEFEHRLLYCEPGNVETGKPAGAIVNFAKEQDVDTIVLGTHGRSGLRRLLAGSVAESVLHDAHCTVVTIRQPTQ
jgi:nucleotide-binding universal stress UspA family protein